MPDERLLFFATDVHGSEVCFRKWLNAAKAYGADVLVLGGDITGKVIVPLHGRNGSWFGRWRDADVSLEGEAELNAFERRVADAGAYVWHCEPDEAAETFGDDAATDALFERLASDRMRSWVALADERLGASGADAYAIAGNDDPPAVDEALAAGERLAHADRRVVWIDDWLPMLSLGDSTPTPWASPRELPEDEYAKALEELAAALPHPEQAIFNVHVPPYDSALDLAPELDRELRVRYSAAGEVRQAPVGCRAVRAAIERLQPLVGLHGHVHESRGRAKLGRTACFNPGSEYTQGVLHGVLLRLSRRRGVRDYVFTAG